MSDVSKNGLGSHDVNRRYELPYVTVDGMFDGAAVSVVLDCVEYVFVHATYADELPEGVVPVGDGRCNGYDTDGNRLVSVPVELCSFVSEEDAAAIDAMIEADNFLLECAR